MKKKRNVSKRTLTCIKPYKSASLSGQLNRKRKDNCAGCRAKTKIIHEQTHRILMLEEMILEFILKPSKK